MLYPVLSHLFSFSVFTVFSLGHQTCNCKIPDCVFPSDVWDCGCLETGVIFD